MRKCFLCLFLAILPALVRAQEERVIRAALYVSGASCPEELPAGLTEELEALPPVRVNSDRLRPGVLLSSYQVACIRDYRSRCGDILSAAELALVDGFSPQAAEALSPLVDFSSGRAVGATDTLRLRATALYRKTLAKGGGKARASGDGWRAGLAWRGQDGTVYGEARWQELRVLAGDFHTRFGQGLAAWTGFSVTSLSTLDAFLKRPGGLSPAWSYSSDNQHRGLALEWSGAHLQALAYAGRGKEFGAHAEYLWLGMQLGASLLYAPSGLAYSLEGRGCTRGVDWAWEAALRNHSPAAVLSLSGKGPENWRWASQLRMLPSRYSGKKNGEYALAAGVLYKTHSLTADAALLPIPGGDARRFQLRVYAGLKWMLSPHWQLELRGQERYRNYEAPRTDFRADAHYNAEGSFLANFRLETVHCASWGALGYAEGGYKGGKVTLYLRTTLFCAPQWAARIYCYERDAPGTFSVPAYYGRGVALSAVASSGKWRLGRFTLRGYLRAGYMVRMDRKPAPTLNLQIQADY